ncbi:MAG: hypothetical protein M3458_12555 [Acidobacteriota bacterium]|nr:hypothetical protein [Acidobacteriota bacterium]
MPLIKSVGLLTHERRRRAQVLRRRFNLSDALQNLSIAGRRKLWRTLPGDGKVRCTSARLQSPGGENQITTELTWSHERE